MRIIACITKYEVGFLRPCDRASIFESSNLPKLSGTWVEGCLLWRLIFTGGDQRPAMETTAPMGVPDDSA